MWGLFSNDAASATAYLSHPLFLVFWAFALWMVVDALRRQEWLWVVLILLFTVISAPLYFVLVYRRPRSAGSFWGVIPFVSDRDRARMQTLEQQIRHLDRAHHHLELGEIYYQRGQWDRALNCFLKAMEREPEDREARARLGQCLLRLDRAPEAKPILQSVCAEDPEHDYGETLMALAECQMKLGEKTAAIASWRQVLERHTYTRARVLLGELLLETGQPDAASRELELALAEEVHAAEFQRERDRVWLNRARSLLERL
jgi:tetratricopeptide (TPR) repeat protein